MVLNLLVNARQAMPSGGQIVVRLSHDPAAGTVDLMIRDSGSGIPADKLPRIFDRFYTTKQGPDASGKGGTGLGLAFCRDVIEAHHGRIRVESTVGRGTAFTLKLPAHVPAVGCAGIGRHGTRRCRWASASAAVDVAASRQSPAVRPQDRARRASSRLRRAAPGSSTPSRRRVGGTASPPAAYSAGGTQSGGRITPGGGSPRRRARLAVAEDHGPEPRGEVDENLLLQGHVAAQLDPAHASAACP